METKPSVRKLKGIYVLTTVGELWFPTETAFQKFWNNQTDDVKRNLTVKTT